MIEKKNGIKIQYDLKKDKITQFDQKLFGFYSKKTLKSGKNEVYYFKGILDSIKFCRFKDETGSSVFIETLEKVDFNNILPYCTKFIVSSVSIEVEPEKLLTGRERAHTWAKAQGFEDRWK